MIVFGLLHVVVVVVVVGAARVVSSLETVAGVAVVVADLLQDDVPIVHQLFSVA